MELEEEEYLSFWERHQQDLKSLLILLVIGGFFAGYYYLPVMRGLLDRAVQPAVAGITGLYGRVSTFLYGKTGWNLGFVQPKTDPDFIFRVQLATYINEKKASPIIDIIVDHRVELSRRQQALKSLLKFESTADWVQPFLNELPRGGMLGLYEKESPLLDEVMARIRSEGGIQGSLVRAYAEVVFGFMLQAQDAIVREKALGWLSDVLAEDGLFFIIHRIGRETDKGVRIAIEGALWDVRSVSDQVRARKELSAYYKHPPWPELKLPLAVVLGRLGANTRPFLKRALEFNGLSNKQRVDIKVAMSHTPYPKKLRITELARRRALKRHQAREVQYRLAYAKRRRIARQEKLQAVLLSRTHGKLSREAQQKNPVIMTERRLAKRSAKVSEEKPSARPETHGKNLAVETPVKKEEPKTIPLPMEIGQEKKPLEVEEFVEPPETPEAELHANLPETRRELPPPQLHREGGSNMRAVDMIFEIQKQEVPLYENPGVGKPTTVVLPVGTKGKAQFEVAMGEDKWVRLKSEKGNGWAASKLLKLYDLAPVEVRSPTTSSPPTNGSTGRKENTYFEANIEAASVFNKPDSGSGEIATLAEGVAYLAITSKKAGGNRWFQLEIREGLTGWVRGTDLQLADVFQPSREETSSGSFSQRGLKSAFSPEWIVASVKGVGVYTRPSIAAEMTVHISPPHMYPVVDTQSDKSGEWYKIEVSKGEEGWVKAMDVSLTKPR